MRTTPCDRARAAVIQRMLRWDAFAVFPRSPCSRVPAASDAEGSGLGGVRLPLDRAALSVALGRENVVHLALTDPAAAERIAAPLERLLHFLAPAKAHGVPARAGADDAAAGQDLNEQTADEAALLATTIPDHGRAQAELKD